MTSMKGVACEVFWHAIDLVTLHSMHSRSLLGVQKPATRHLSSFLDGINNDLNNKVRAGHVFVCLLLHSIPRCSSDLEAGCFQHFALWPSLHKGPHMSVASWLSRQMDMVISLILGQDYQVCAAIFYGTGFLLGSSLAQVLFIYALHCSRHPAYYDLVYLMTSCCCR